jgi:hypothetical protein
MKKTVFNIIPEHQPVSKRDPMDTVCEFKWNYPIFQMDRGEFRSCCRTPPQRVTESQLQEKGIDAFLNSDHLKQSRLDLINGIRHSDCKTCWGLEDKGMQSPREPEQFWNFMQREGMIPREHRSTSINADVMQEALAKVTTTDHKFITSKKPYMLELSLGNTCDLKCMYCNHHYSTQWATELIKTGEITQEQYDREFPAPALSFESKFWEWFDRIGRFNIHRVNIIGGEPLIIPKFYEYIDTMREKLKLLTLFPDKIKPILCIVTNLNTPPNYFKRFIDRLPVITEVFDVEIIISMESLEGRAEYIRNGIDWDRFNSNVNKLFSIKDVKFNTGFLMTVSALSIATTKDFVQYATELSRKHNRPVHLKQNIINYPKWQSPMILTPDFAKYVDDAINYMEQQVDTMPATVDFSGRYDQYIIFLKSLSTSLKTNTGNYLYDRADFRNWFSKYDVTRNLNFKKTFPEYIEFWNNCPLFPVPK